MTREEMNETFIATLEGIMCVCDRTTSGNVSHNVATIKGKCRDMLQFYEKFPVNPWHSVADGDWPKWLKGDAEDMPFVVISKGGHQFFAYYDEDEDGICYFYDDCDCPLDVEYWMEIPQLPEKGGTE